MNEVENEESKKESTRWTGAVVSGITAIGHMTLSIMNSAIVSQNKTRVQELIDAASKSDGGDE